MLKIFFLSFNLNYKKTWHCNNIIVSIIFVKIALCKILNANFNSVGEEKSELPVVKLITIKFSLKDSWSNLLTSTIHVIINYMILHLKIFSNLLWLKDYNTSKTE